MMPKEIRDRFKAIKAEVADLDSSGDRVGAGDSYFTFTKELLGTQAEIPRHIRRTAARTSYQALIRYLMDGKARKMNDVIRLVENHQLSDLSYQLESTVNRAKEFLEEKGWEDIETIAEGTDLSQIDAIQQANEIIRTAKIKDSNGDYIAAADSYIKASKILFSALKGKLLSERSRKPVKKAILRLVMADEWEMASEFILLAQSHSVSVDQALERKVESRKKLIDQYTHGEREIRILANVDLHDLSDPEETVGRVMRNGFPFSFAEYEEINVLSAWRLDYLRGVVPVELGDICPEGTENVPIKKLIGSVHDNYGADTLMLDFNTPHFSGAMVFSTSEALDLEIVHFRNTPA
ncbi:MAG: hypothetical protein ACE5OZ_21380 [Candidatus Heimdallarchaeota archaeon]